MAEGTDKIKYELIEFYNKIKDRYSVKKLLLYGSYAAGTARKNSDIDVGVVIDLGDNIDPIRVASDLFHYAREIDTDIEPLYISWQDYQNHEPASILGDIIRNSIHIIS